VESIAGRGRGEHTRFSASAGLSAPSINRAAADVKPCSPAMGRYSWLSSGSSRRIASA